MLDAPFLKIVKNQLEFFDAPTAKKQISCTDFNFFMHRLPKNLMHLLQIFDAPFQQFLMH